MEIKTFPTMKELPRERLVQYIDEELLAFRELLGRTLVQLREDLDMEDWFNYRTRRIEDAGVAFIHAT